MPGMSPALANAILDAIADGVPLVVPVTTLGVHLGDPGADGDENPADLTTRVAVKFTRTADGVLNLVSSSAPLVATTAESWSHISVWSGFPGDPDEKFLFSAAARPPKTVAEGDIVDPTTFSLILPGLAA